MAEDALTVIDLNPGSGFAESARVEIPPGYLFAFSMLSAETTNTTAMARQGVRVQFPALTARFSRVTNSSAVISNSVPVNPYAGPGWLLGPAYVSTFSSNSPTRLQLYVRPVEPDIQVGSLFGPGSSAQVEVAAGQILIPVTTGGTGWYWHGAFPTAVTSISLPSGAEFSGVDVLSVGLSLVSAIPMVSSQTRYATTVAGSHSFGSQIEEWNPLRAICGPATVTFSTITNSASANHFGFYGYRLLSASYQSSSSAATNSNSNFSNVQLLLERSTNLSSWTTIDSMTITDTSDRAFYRLKPVVQ